MDMIRKFEIILIYLFIFLSNVFAQNPTGDKIHCREIFTAVEVGVDNGVAEAFSAFFAKQVYVSVRSGESGLYSSNQAYYILKNYLSTRKPLGFTFTTYGTTDNTPFATGRASFRYKGTREFVQVFVSLSRVEDDWVIDKINIY
jgi:hypothetical protein